MSRGCTASDDNCARLPALIVGISVQMMSTRLTQYMATEDRRLNHRFALIAIVYLFLFILHFVHATFVRMFYNYLIAFILV